MNTKTFNTARDDSKETEMTVVEKLISGMKSIKADNTEVQGFVVEAIEVLERLASGKAFPLGSATRCDVDCSAERIRGKAIELDTNGDVRNAQIALAASTSFIGVDYELSYEEGAKWFEKALRILKENA